MLCDLLRLPDAVYAGEPAQPRLDYPTPGE